jgi:hypothetical protein
VVNKEQTKVVSRTRLGAISSEKILHIIQYKSITYSILVYEGIGIYSEGVHGSH